MKVEDVGTYWTTDKEDIWQMITYCEYPTATMLNIRIGERVGGAVGCPNLQPFKKLVVQGETK